jgi:hypothetical protein
MNESYVEQRNEGYWITGSRVSLESVVWAFLDGLSPETIATEYFPVLTLEQTYGAIAYYLGHREAVNGYLRQADSEYQTFHQTVSEPDFTRKLAQARRGLLVSHA